jgi:sRNA-binding regulator protein Hfq
MHLLRESKKRQHRRSVSLGICAGILMQESIKELKSLVVLLSNGSQTEPYLAHLAQGLQAVEQAA